VVVLEHKIGCSSAYVKDMVQNLVPNIVFNDAQFHVNC